MGELTTSLTADAEMLREAYAALNRNDIPAFCKIFDPQVEWIFEFPGGGTYRGFTDVQAHVSQSRETWAEGSCEPQRFVVAGDKVIVCTRVHVRLKHETQWREGNTGDVYTFRDGKVVQVRTFAEEQQAFEWAGVKDSDAG